MRYVRLVAVEDEYDTSPGLVVKGTVMSEGMMADRDGTLIAHDLLEHQNGIAAIGPIDDELIALGAIWQVRGRHGDFLFDRPSLANPVENVAADIIRMARELTGYDWYPKLGRYRTHRHDYDEDFRDIIAEAGAGIPKELDRDELRDFPKEAYLDNALHLMRTGFRKAERRFGTGYYGHNLFRAVKEAVKRCRPEFTGQEFILGYGDGKAVCREVYDDDWYG